MMIRTLSLGVLALALCLTLTQCDRGRDGRGAALFGGGKAPVDFVRDVQPLLEIECLQCHNRRDAASNAGLNLETREAALATGRQAPVIVPGDPESSLLIQVLKLDSQHAASMPPAPDKIWGERMDILERWIAAGAPWPEGVRLLPPDEWTDG